MLGRFLKLPEGVLEPGRSERRQSHPEVPCFVVWALFARLASHKASRLAHRARFHWFHSWMLMCNPSSFPSINLCSCAPRSAKISPRIARRLAHKLHLCLDGRVQQVLGLLEVPLLDFRVEGLSLGVWGFGAWALGSAPLWVLGSGLKVWCLRIWDLGLQCLILSGIETRLK